MKKLYLFLILGILLVSTFGIVSAQPTEYDTPQGNNPAPIPSTTNFIQQFFINLHYQAQQIGLFTTAGTDRKCSYNADLTDPIKYLNPTHTLKYYTSSSLLISAGCSGHGLVNTFDSNWNIVAEFDLEQYSSIPYWMDGHVEVYCCPYKACATNTDCVNMNQGTTCNPSTGACTGTNPPSWTTTIYTCQFDGTWKNTGTATYGQNGFCSTGSTYKAYVRYGQSASSAACYTSAQSGWCTSQTCTPSWSCGNWGTCSSGFQTRTCTDIKSCGTTAGKPTEQQSCTNPEPTEPIQVSNIMLAKDTSGGAYLTAEHEREFKVTLKNTGTTVQTVNVEAGFYTQKYAQNIACLIPKSTFAISSFTPTQNCVNEPFVKTVAVTIQPGNSITVPLYVAPLNAYVTLDTNVDYIVSATPLVSFLGVYRTCCKPLGAEGSCSGCSTGTGGYIGSDYDPTFKVPNKADPWDALVTCGGVTYGHYYKLMFGEDTIRITRSYRDCIQKVWGFTENGTAPNPGKSCVTNADCTPQICVGGFCQNSSVAYGALKKLPIVAGDVILKTAGDLIASSCISDTNCLVPNNFTSSCVNYEVLVGSGLLLPSQVQSVQTLVHENFPTSKINTGTWVGLGICAGAGIAAAPFTLGISLGTAFAICSIGAPFAQLLPDINVGVDPTDPLLIALNKLTVEQTAQGVAVGNLGGAGLCIAVPKVETGGFDINGLIVKYFNWFKIVEDPVTNAWIIFGGLIVLIILLFNMMNRK